MSKKIGKIGRNVARALLLGFAFVVSVAQPAMGQSSTTEELPFTPLVALLPEPDPVPKSRYISFQPPRQGAPVALRVTLTDGRAPFNALSGLYKWVDAPTEIHDAANASEPVYVGRLTDRPVFVDWSTINVLHVGDRYIFPDTVYEVQAIAAGCSPYDMNCYSPALEVRTARWGDVTGPHDEAGRAGPDGVISFTDIGGIVEAVKSIPSAPPLLCCDLDGEVPSASINFSDIGRALEAFKEIEYPFAQGLTECYRELSERSVPRRFWPDPGFIQLQIGPIDGLTTAWHDAPSLLAVPVGTTLHFLSPDIPPVSTVSWCGANPASGEPAGAAAQRVFDRVGPQLVQVTVTPFGRQPIQDTLGLDVLDISIDEIEVGPIRVSVAPFDVEKDASNEITMEYFFGGPIAPLRQVGENRYRTSVERRIHLSVNVDPPVFEPLIEWRYDGYLGGGVGTSLARTLNSVGKHTFSAGPPDRERSIEIETYKVTITSHETLVDIVPEGQPITFEAVTDPPGYEDDITWLSTTKYGTATPVLGQGRTFTVQFNDTFGAHFDGGLWQWLGVKADNATFGQDQKTGACCFQEMLCADRSEEDCLQIGGEYPGDGASCELCSFAPIGSRCRYIVTSVHGFDCVGGCWYRVRDLITTLELCDGPADCRQNPFSFTQEQPCGTSGTCTVTVAFDICDPGRP